MNTLILRVVGITIATYVLSYFFFYGLLTIIFGEACA